MRAPKHQKRMKVSQGTTNHKRQWWNQNRRRQQQRRPPMELEQPMRCLPQSWASRSAGSKAGAMRHGTITSG